MKIVMTGNDIFKSISSLAPETIQIIFKELRNTFSSEKNPQLIFQFMRQNEIT